MHPPSPTLANTKRKRAAASDIANDDPRPEPITVTDALVEMAQALKRTINTFPSRPKMIEPGDLQANLELEAKKMEFWAQMSRVLPAEVATELAEKNLSAGLGLDFLVLAGHKKSIEQHATARALQGKGSAPGESRNTAHDR